MKILIYGQPWREGMPASLAHAFRKLGHEVDLFDFTRFLYRKRLGKRWAQILDIALQSQVSCRVNQALTQQIEQDHYDLIVFCNDAHVWPKTLSRATDRCRAVVQWTFDEPFNRKYTKPATLDLFRLYHLILTPREHLIEEYRAKGAGRVHHLRFCFDPEVHYPVLPRETEMSSWAADVTFVGTWSRRREQIVTSLPGVDVKVWGYSWGHATQSTKSVSRLTLMQRTAEGREMSLVLNASKISLNLLTPEQQDRVNVRNLEIPACGGFQLCERTPELQTLFREGIEVACFGSLDEMKEKVDYYLRHDSEREAIAKAAHERLMASRFTYIDRAQEIISLTS
jgi:spore maturation protein CgeB